MSNKMNLTVTTQKPEDPASGGRKPPDPLDVHGVHDFGIELISGMPG
jgi:hypothetical protein